MTQSADYDALVTALRAMPDEMSNAWGDDSRWLTSGSHVAELVRDWLEKTIDEARVCERPDECAAGGYCREVNP